MSTSLAPMRLGQQRRTALTRRKLLEAALALISERGFDATTAADIGRRAGYSRALVHAHFGSKEALIDSLLKSEYEDRLIRPADLQSPGLDRAMALIDHLQTLLAEDAALVRAIFVLIFESAHRTSEVHLRIRAWLTRLENYFCDAFAAGLRDGSVTAGVDPAEAARAFMETGIGFFHYWISQSGAEMSAAELNRCRQHLLSLARAAPARSTSGSRSPDAASSERTRVLKPARSRRPARS